jgi:hypothetical protein
LVFETAYKAARIPKVRSNRLLAVLLLFDFGIAIAAVNRSVVARLERNLSFLAAARADGGKELTRRLIGVLPQIAALFAALRLVLEASLSVEFLFTRGESEIFAAFLALKNFVLIHD